MRLLNEECPKVENGESVVYWMRMEDMRRKRSQTLIWNHVLISKVEDNTALSKASKLAKDLSIPLVTLFVLSPGDYKWHDRSSKRIDFMLRNLRYLKVSLIFLVLDLRLTRCRASLTNSTSHYILSLMINALRSPVNSSMRSLPP